MGGFFCGTQVARLHLVELELERDVFGALVAVVVAETTAFDLHVLAHVYAPRIVRVAGEKAVVADLN